MKQKLLVKSIDQLSIVQKGSVSDDQVINAFAFLARPAGSK